MEPIQPESPRPGAAASGAIRQPVRPDHIRGMVGVLESYERAQRNLLELIPEEAFSETIISGANPGRFHMIMAPQDIRRVLQTRVEDYPKSDLARSVLRPAIGDSMLVAEGAEWRRQRRAAAPAFNPRHVAGLGPVMSAAAERSVDRIGAQVSRAANLLDETIAATFEVIADVTFSGDPGVGRDTVLRAIEAYGAAAGKLSFLDVLGAPDWVPRPSRLRPDPRMAEMQQMADERVAARRAKGREGAPDLLDLLLAAEAGDEAGLSAQDVRDNLLAFIVAGHETTALTLAWALYLCGLDPEAQAKASDEARRVLGRRVATAADVPKLPVIRALLDETLRLYPAAGFLSRVATEVDELGGVTVLPGDTVTVPVYAVHRHGALWTEPDAFVADRFADGVPVERYAYLPFGDGPRICIGASFALQEAMIILSTLLARFRFHAVPGKEPVPTLIITLRPEGGVWLEVEALD